VKEGEGDESGAARRASPPTPLFILFFASSARYTRVYPSPLLLVRVGYATFTL
jgi:hypothetical protein